MFLQFSTPLRREAARLSRTSRLFFELLEPRSMMIADGVGFAPEPVDEGSPSSEERGGALIVLPIANDPARSDSISAGIEVTTARNSAPVVSNLQVVEYDAIRHVERVLSLEDSLPTVNDMALLVQTATSLGYEDVGEYVAAFTDVPPLPAPEVSSVTQSGDGAISPTGIFGNDSRRLVPNPRSYPHTAVGRLWMSFPNRESSCSASLIGPYHVLTAGHCIYNLNSSSFAEQIYFSAAQDGERIGNSFRRSEYEPYGEARAVYYRVFTGYKDQGNYGYDIGLLTLDRNLGNFTGYLGYGYNNDEFFEGPITSTAGYPADLTPDTFDQWEINNGNVISQSILPNELRSNTMDVYSGQSGSPIWIGGDAHPVSYGVISYEKYTDVNDNGKPDSDDRFRYNSAARITRPKFNAINRWRAADDNDRAPTDKPDLVDFDNWFNEITATTSRIAVEAGESFSVTSHVRNNGTANSGAFRVSFYASPNKAISSSDYLLGTVSLTSLAPFATRATTLSLSSFPNNIPEGRYYVGWIIDSDDDVTEFLESNNTGYLPDRVLNVLDPADDHGDNAVVATPVSVPSTTLGNIETSGDSDWFRFTAIKGAEYTIRTDLLTLPDSVLTLYNTNGKQVLVVNDDDPQAPGSTASRIVWQAPADGRYYLKVAAHTAGQTGTYSLEVAQTDDPPVPAPTKGRFFVVDEGVDKTFRYRGDGGPINSSSLTTSNTAPQGIAAHPNGKKVWVVDGDGFVYVYNSSGKFLYHLGLKGIFGASGIATDGKHLWVVSSSRARVYFFAQGASLRRGVHAPTSSFALRGGNTAPQGLTMNGSILWVVDGSPFTSTKRVFVYRRTGTLLGSWETSFLTPAGIAIDPANPSDLWIVGDGVPDRVYRFVNGAKRRNGSQVADEDFVLPSGNAASKGIAIVPRVRQSGASGPNTSAPSGATSPASASSKDASQEQLAALLATSLPFGAGNDFPRSRTVSENRRDDEFWPEYGYWEVQESVLATEVSSPELQLYRLLDDDDGALEQSAPDSNAPSVHLAVDRRQEED